MLKQLMQQYAGKKVFLTGHTGFKGSWLLKILNLLGADVKGYALVPKTPNDLYHLIDGDSLCTSVIADVRDRSRLVSEIANYNPDFVFHLAAQPQVGMSYDIPSETFAVNVIGTANILDGIIQIEKKCNVVLITTDKVYHNHEWAYPYRENDRLGGYDPYSASKACAELVIDSYRNSFFNIKVYDLHRKGIAVARAGNVIGGGDWSKGRLLPDIVRSLGDDDRIEVRNPTSIRPWQHVLEALSGYLQLGIKLVEQPQQFSQAYNFGPCADDALSVQTIVNMAINYWEKGEFQIVNAQNYFHEANILKLDITKAMEEIGWKPKWKATIAVARTIEWYKQFYADRKSISLFTEQQIINFL